MKNILLLLILLVFGCNDRKETEFIKEQDQRKEKEKKTRTYADAILEMDAEKLALLSIIKKIPNDTLHLVLKDYLNKTISSVSDVNKVDK